MSFKGLLPVLFLIFTGQTLFAQANQPIYTIHIGTFMQASPNDFLPVQGLGFLYAEELGGNLYKIFLGGYKDRNAADAVLAQVQSKGYIDAYVGTLDLSFGSNAALIQLGIKPAGQVIDWNQYLSAGPLYVIQEDKQVKILTGIFQDVNTAKTQLTQIRKQGFKDAFVKTVNSALLHPIDAFHLGAQATAAMNQTPTPQQNPGGSTPNNGQIPKSYNQSVPPPQQGNYPPQQTYPVQPTFPVSYETPTILTPNIRAKVKRSSVASLQRLLKSEGSYKSSIDGYYGKGTTAAYLKTAEENGQIQKYTLLAASKSTLAANASGNTLQYHINNLLNAPEPSMYALTAFDAPIARAYQAYLTFLSAGPGLEVNNLMNAAIQVAYSGQALTAESRFDHTASYAYADIEQIVRHILYIHTRSKQTASVPCWLTQAHAQETRTAFSLDPNLAAELPTEDCGGVLNWPEVQVLMAMAQDIAGASQISEKEVGAGQSKTAQFLLSPAKPDADALKVANTWYDKTTKGVYQWGTQDPWLQEISMSFRILLYQSQVMLEDYYMDQGLKNKEAVNLGKVTLQAMLEPYLKRFAE